MADKSLDIKEHVLDLLRSPEDWNAFRASPDSAIKIAKSWGLDITRDQAENIIYVFSVYRAKIYEAHLTLINTIVPGSILLRSEPLAVPHSNPLLGVASTGKLGNGPVPHLDARVSPLDFRFEMPAYMVLSAGHAFGF